jgi:hypothetical protein
MNVRTEAVEAVRKEVQEAIDAGGGAHAVMTVIGHHIEKLGAVAVKLGVASDEGIVDTFIGEFLLSLGKSLYFTEENN